MPPLLIVLLAWVVLAALCLGLGRLVVGLLGPRARGFEPLWAQLWLGWAALVVVGEALHLVVPLDGRVFLALALGAAAGLWRTRRTLGVQLREALRAFPLAAVLLVACALFLALNALQPPRNPDSGLYYVETVRWYQRFAAVPGLGNLHHRLAFNHAYFVWATLCDVGPLLRHGHHVANGLLLLAALAPALAALEGLARGRSAPSIGDLAWACVLSPLCDLALGNNLSSPAADLAVAAFGAVLAVLYLRRLETGAPSLPLLAFLAATAVSVKPSLVCIAAPCVIAAALQERRQVRRWALPTAGAALLAVVPWAAHGVVQSGYPFFPSTFGNLHLRWRVPEHIAEAERRYLTAWGRGAVRWAPTPGSEDQPWVEAWLQRAWLDNRLFLIPLSLLLVLALALALRARLLSSADRRLAPWLLLPWLGALLLWWILSPDLRHLGPVPWVLLAALAWLVQRTLAEQVLVPRTLAAAAALLAAGAFVGAAPRWSPPSTFPPLPPPPSRTARLASGDQIWIMDSMNGCWDLPCAVEELPIRVRRPGDLSSGFESDEVR